MLRLELRIMIAGSKGSSMKKWLQNSEWSGMQGGSPGRWETN